MVLARLGIRSARRKARVTPEPDTAPRQEPQRQRWVNALACMQDDVPDPQKLSGQWWFKHRDCIATLIQSATVEVVADLLGLTPAAVRYGLQLLGVKPGRVRTPQTPKLKARPYFHLQGAVSDDVRRALNL